MKMQLALVLISLMTVNISNAMGKKHGIPSLPFALIVEEKLNRMMISSFPLSAVDFEELKKIPGCIINHTLSTSEAQEASKVPLKNSAAEREWYALLHTIKFDVESKKIPLIEGIKRLNSLKSSEDEERKNAFKKVFNLFNMYSSEKCLKVSTCHSN